MTRKKVDEQGAFERGPEKILPTREQCEEMAAWWAAYDAEPHRPPRARRGTRDACPSRGAARKGKR